ncbi:coiled-coil domain-containing protein 117 isoform X2 [Myripristis murdjan]|uniref:coiled-coil domain-containing protein 117 isoform X2 n=1 Tax=Myripristis murdjan TaxID=586833 RepID=UPI0011760A17|nr:coiled-coil domain-containing protein 117 isoform X2 [Myripristis murdjan]
MHHSSPTSSELAFSPAMYSFSGLTSLPELRFDLGPPSGSGHLQRGALSNTWERRCLRKHRRRTNDEGCSAKRRRLMVEADSDILENSSSNIGRDWPPASSCPPLSTQQASPAPPQPCLAPQDSHSSQSSATVSRPETEDSCMEIEAAQRRLQEIEDRITLEDDDEDEDLGVEPAQRRPVLVMSDSLREGLQRGISDILPHTVAQSVSHSCMELVVWRPPEDALSRRLKDSLQRQRKQQTACRQPPTPCPSPTPESALSPTSPPGDTYAPVHSFPGAHSSGEEDMEL